MDCRSIIAPTPPMGWNSWNTFGENIDEKLVKDVANIFVRDGYKDAGYEYVVIDDLWEADERTADGKLTWDTDKFPSGIPALADYIHSKGLKFGIYSCSGIRTCAGKPASYGYEEVDAQTFAEWGVDFLKYDYCYKPMGVSGPELYRKMGQALRATGRPILFSACEWGHNNPATWGRFAGAHMWRTTGDIVDSWDSMLNIAEKQAGLEVYAGPNAWNDPDMLVVGMYGRGNAADGGMSDTEYKVHFALWCMLASPLMIGCDVRKATVATKQILLNPGFISVNQDPLGVQGRGIGYNDKDWEGQDFQVWSKPLSDGSIAVAFFNFNGDRARTMVAPWAALAIHDHRPCHVLDLWTAQEVGTFDRYVEAHVQPHDVVMYKVTPAPSDAKIQHQRVRKAGCDGC
ncbi:MAG: glycoside hydrolase family 27 protein [Armatimonadetes bacterium]|nr:glycoside hydrolase family 27 protein [Armatimonadota bacterium]